MENELYDQPEWERGHRAADKMVFAKDGGALAAIYISPNGRSRSEHAQYVAMLQAWANNPPTP